RIQQVRDERLHPQRRPMDQLEVATYAVILILQRHQHRDAELDRPERAAQVMGDDREDLLSRSDRETELVFHLLALGDLRGDTADQRRVRRDRELDRQERAYPVRGTGRSLRLRSLVPLA